MTREEQIKQAGKACNFGKCHRQFRLGAEYADAHPNWISVEDELPKNGDCALIFSKYGYMDVSIYNNGEWDCGRRGSEYLQNQVTHWMPIPQPPVVSKMENTGKDLK